MGRRHGLTAAALGAAAVLALPGTGAAAEGTGPPAAVRPTDRMIVKLAEGTPAGEAPSLVARGSGLGAEGVGRTVDGAEVVAVSGALGPREQEALVARLEADPAVEYAEPDRVVSTAALTADPLSPAQWNLSALALPQAWARATGAGQVIAVVDTGVTAHPDLARKVLPGYDFVSSPWHSRDGDGRDPDPRDEGDWASPGECYAGAEDSASSWHGTHVAGIAAASTDNGLGVAGTARDARILPARVVGRCGDGYVSDIVDALAWSAGATVKGVPANAHPADVVNLSLSYHGQCGPSMQAAVDSAARRGVPVVVAAGNQAVDAAAVAPANCAGVIAVGAATPEGRTAAYSNVGAVVDVLAPGGLATAPVLSTVDTGGTRPAGAGYGGKYGTSMAAPHVAGTVALLRELNGGLSPGALARTLRDTATGSAGQRQVAPAAALAAVRERPVFPDVPVERAFSREIRWAKLQGLLGGWPDGTFRPDRPIERAAMAAVVHRMAGSPAYTPPAGSAYADVAPGDPFYREIHWARERGLLTGWPDGTFRPTAPIARDATAALLHRAAGSPAYAAPPVSRFGDVPRAHPFYAEIHWLRGTGITTGWPDGTFRPLATTGRDAMAAFLHRYDRAV